ncbi:MAG: PEP-CTERM sorting domain-containing protein [Candidatus Krumholzibacteriia bacterium]
MRLLMPVIAVFAQLLCCSASRLSAEESSPSLSEELLDIWNRSYEVESVDEEFERDEWSDWGSFESDLEAGPRADRASDPLLGRSLTPHLDRLLGGDATTRLPGLPQGFGVPRSSDTPGALPGSVSPLDPGAALMKGGSAEEGDDDSDHHHDGRGKKHRGRGHGHHGGGSHGGGRGSHPIEPVPEPGTLLLAGIASAAAIGARVRRKKREVLDTRPR